MSQTSESKPAGMWRPIELTDGDIVKLFQSGEHGERNYRQFDGEWYVLDESPEGLNAVKEHFRVEYIRADLLRPSVEQVLVRCLNTLILRCPEYGELILDCKKALASIPRADSPDHVPESGKMVDSPEKCPECGGDGYIYCN